MTGVILTILFLHPKLSYSQEHEIGVWGGIAQAFGDINSELNSFQFYQPAGGIFYKYNFNPRIGINSGFSVGSTEGYDYVSPDVFQTTRNLDFHTSITEVYSRIDFHFFSFDRTKPKEWFTPYVFTGINAYYFNPQGLYLGNWIDLQPLGTEGQYIAGNENKAYKRLQIGIPLGGGFKFALNENWAIGIEGNWHKLFTDYFDDVSTEYVDPFLLLSSDPDGDITAAMADKSALVQDVPALGEQGRQRGDQNKNDAYFYAGITLSYTIVNLKCPPPSAKGFKRK